MNQEYNTSNPVTGDELNGNVASPEGKENVSKESELTLQELNSLTGRKFESKEDALKSLKETFNFVGKRKEDIEKEILENQKKANDTSDLAKQLNELKHNLFYSQNPQYEPYRAVIGKLGDNPAEVINTAEFKDLFEKAKGFDASQKSKSVLESNPRIAVAKGHIDKAREAVMNGRQVEAESYAARAVIEAFGLDNK